MNVFARRFGRRISMTVRWQAANNFWSQMKLIDRLLLRAALAAGDWGAIAAIVFGSL